MATDFLEEQELVPGITLFLDPHVLEASGARGPTWRRVYKEHPFVFIKGDANTGTWLPLFSSNISGSIQVPALAFSGAMGNRPHYWIPHTEWEASLLAVRAASAAALDQSKNGERNHTDLAFYFGFSAEKTYRVVWAIDIEARDPVVAAATALKFQRDPESRATVFYVSEDPFEAWLHLDNAQEIDLSSQNTVHDPYQHHVEAVQGLLEALKYHVRTGRLMKACENARSVINRMLDVVEQAAVDARGNDG